MEKNNNIYKLKNVIILMRRGEKVMIFLGLLILLIVPLASAENVSTCRELNQSNTIYTLTQDISDLCLVIQQFHYTSFLFLLDIQL